MPESIVNLSVREMVEFILRSGSIDSGYSAANRAQEGTRIHQHVQKERKKQAALAGIEYASEVVLKLTFEHGGFQYNLEGRADGIVKTETYTAIEEIKSTMRGLDTLVCDPAHWHWAQAKCYAYMYGVTADETDTEIRVHLTYCHLETEESRTFEESFTFEALKSFFFEVIEKYHMFAAMDASRIQTRCRTAKELGFPYGAYRKGQREMCVSVYAAVKQSKKLFAQAPTGIGKTISALYPSVKALGEGIGDKIFYLTAKTITRQVAEEAMEIMARHGLMVRSVTLTAKDKICFLEIRSCDPRVCPYADGHFDRANDAVYDIIQAETRITRSVIERYAKKHRICPFEFSLDISLFCDVIICDYNYFYDPRASLKRFFAEKAKTNFFVLNDEAHNLVDRAREMFSAGVSKSQYMEGRRLLPKKALLYRKLSAINRYFLDELKDMGDAKTRVRIERPKDLTELLNSFASVADEWLVKQNTDPAATPDQVELVQELYFRALDFARIGELYDKRYVTFLERNHHDLTVRLLCVDPSYLLSLAQKKIRASVFFSATLTPLEYFKGVLGGGEEDYTLRLASPFDRQNLCLMVEGGISTKYKDRENSYMQVADSIWEMTTARRGNYMVFFSSYAYMNSTYAIFAEKYPQVKTVTQAQNMDEETREDFLRQFSEDNAETLLAFVVLGGIFSEGIDLKGERLIGTAIVGVGLPLITEERNLVSDYYDRQNGRGFDFAYVYPGMNKVLQAAGRVIRSETDRGVVLLMDSRYLSTTYRELFPDEWAHHVRLRGVEQIKRTTAAFWERKTLE